ncbi:hypothetical protein ES703_101800 [subsurface metagenome]
MTVLDKIKSFFKRAKPPKVAEEKPPKATRKKPPRSSKRKSAG